MAIKITATAFLILFFTTGARAEPNQLWDFHGLSLNASEQTIAKAFPEFSCKDDGPIRRCAAYFKFDERPGFLSNNGATNVGLVFAADKLVNIDIVWIPSLYEESYTNLTSVYGTPLEDKKEEITTRDGRDFENHIVLWHNGKSTIRYDKYWRNIGASRILYLLKE